MGVGYPLDLVVCSALGVDMYDCVYPTRTGRFGTAMVPEGSVVSHAHTTVVGFLGTRPLPSSHQLVLAGLLKLKHGSMAKDIRPLDSGCTCFVCTKYTRSALHAMMKEPQSIGAQLLSYHNIAYMMRLTADMRAAIIANKYVHAAATLDFSSPHSHAHTGIQSLSMTFCPSSSRKVLTLCRNGS